MRHQQHHQLLQIFEWRKEEFHAGRKATMDAFQVANNLGFNTLNLYRKSSHHFWWRFMLSWLWLVKCWWKSLSFPKDSIIFIQYPCNLFSGRLGLRFVDDLRKKRRARVITLIHDLDCIRMHENEEEIQLDDRTKTVTELSDIVIVHNDLMRGWLSKHGVLNDKMVSLKIFDYLLDNIVVPNYVYRSVPTIVIAGNLDKSKAPYIDQVGSIKKVKWNLYGPNYVPNVAGADNVTYCGCYAPEVLQSKIEGMFGLVWDGDSIKTCRGASGEYLKYNNPHKLSFYLASGIPVIVWAEAAVSELVLKEEVGIAVSSLENLGEVLSAIKIEQYERLCQNARNLASKVQSGWFLTSALQIALRKLSYIS